MPKISARLRRTTLATALLVALSAASGFVSAGPAAAGETGAAVTTTFADSFESPVIDVDFVDYVAGQQVGAWKVVSGSVDLTTDWQHAQGFQSMDLNGFNAGAIAHTVPTTVLTTYRVTYALAANPDAGQAIRTGNVKVNGQLLDSFSFDSTGKTVSNMGWVYRSFYFTNTLAASAQLQFASTTPSAWGPVIDDVRVESCLLVLCL
jgi:choice-of-anchor C domain-containing protein